MDTKSVSASRPAYSVEASSRTSQQGVEEGVEEDEPFSLGDTSIAFLGLVMAFAIVGVPLLAVITERPSERESLIPTAFNINGPKFATPFSFPRFSQFSC